VCERHLEHPFPHKDCYARGLPCPDCMHPTTKPLPPDEDDGPMERIDGRASTTTPLFTFTPPTWRGNSEFMAELWRLESQSRLAVCAMWNHPRGAEVRCEIDGDAFQVEAGRDLIQLLEAVDRWRRSLEQQGWTVAAATPPH
jgi:hypothetical protein